MKLKHFLGLIAAIIVAGIILAAAVGSSWFTNKNIKTWFNNWGQNKSETHNPADGPIAISNTGEAMYAGCTYVMPESLAFVSAQSEEVNVGEVVITAELDNEYIADVEYEWEIDWTWTKNESFADSNRVEDCLEVTVYQGETNTAHVKALKPFADTAVLVVKLKKDRFGFVGEADITAQCKIDYLSRPMLVGARGGSVSSFYDKANDVLSSASVSFAFEYSVGSVRGVMEFNEISCSMTDYFAELMKRYITFDFDYKTYNIPNAKENADRKGYDPDDIFNSDKTQASIGFTFYTFELSDFIADFGQYNDKQIEALYYAWYNAFRCDDNLEADSGAVIPNVSWNAFFTYSLNGLELDTFEAERDEEFDCQNARSIKPEIILSNSYIRL